MQRRTFLQASLACGAGGLLVVSRRSKGAEGDTPTPLNVALIGAGLQGRILATAAVSIPHLRFRAICDIWNYSRKTVGYLLRRYDHEVNEYADYRELLEKEADLDAVLIATPDCAHAEQTIACLRAGLHVYCERPMATSYQAAESMAAAARQHGRWLQIGYQHRSNPRYLHVRQCLLKEARLLGRVLYVRGQWYQPIADDVGWPRRFEMAATELEPHGYADMHQLRNWRAYRHLSAGPFAEFCGPHVDAIGWLLDVEPQAVAAMGGRDYHASREWYDQVTALVSYRDGENHTMQGQFQVLTTTSGDGHRSYQHLMGADGSLRMSENPRWTALYREPHAPDWERWVSAGFLKRPEDFAPPTSAEEHVRETGVIVPYQLPVVLEQPIHQPHLENFFATIRGNAELTCPAESALAAERLIHKTDEAAGAGKTLLFGA